MPHWPAVLPPPLPHCISLPAEEAKEEKKNSECDRREWCSSPFPPPFLLFHAPAFRLNSVSNSSINKVFRKRAVCSPFPYPSEWLSVSAAGGAAHAQAHTDTHTPKEFRGGRSQNSIQDHFSDINGAVTAVTAVNAPFLCFLWTRSRWKTGFATLLCHDTVRRGSVECYATQSYMETSRLCEFQARARLQRPLLFPASEQIYKKRCCGQI